MSATKRRPDKELNHDNWNDEDEPEEQGEFQKAPVEEMQKRKILRPTRKLGAAAVPIANPFGAISFGATPSTVPVAALASNSLPVQPNGGSVATPAFKWPSLTPGATEDSEKSSVANGASIGSGKPIAADTTVADEDDECKPGEDSDDEPKEEVDNDSSVSSTESTEDEDSSSGSDVAENEKSATEANDGKNDSDEGGSDTDPSSSDSDSTEDGAE